MSKNIQDKKLMHVHFRINEVQHNKLKKMAYKRDMSLSSLVRYWIDEKMREEG